MPVVVALVLVAAVLAVIAVVAAVIAVRAARRTSAHVLAGRGHSSTSADVNRAEATLPVPGSSPATYTGATEPAQTSEVISGRVVVHPSNRDVVDATMGRPMVRISVLAYGVRYALRPQSRDRILALMRREYRQRRRVRLRAGRRAVRGPQPELSSSWTTIHRDGAAHTGELQAPADARDGLEETE